MSKRTKSKFRLFFIMIIGLIVGFILFNGINNIDNLFFDDLMMDSTNDDEFIDKNSMDRIKDSIYYLELDKSQEKLTTKKLNKTL